MLDVYPLVAKISARIEIYAQLPSAYNNNEFHRTPKIERLVIKSHRLYSTCIHLFMFIVKT